MVVVDFDYLARDRGLFLERVAELSQLPSRTDLCVQLRIRNETLEVKEQLAEQGREAFRNETVPLIWNGDVEIAQKFGFQGCHYPESKLAKLGCLKSDLMHGASIHNEEALNLAHSLGMHYVVYGSVFAPSWKDVRAQGLSGLQSISRLSKLPVLAIGGIQAIHLKAIREAGASGFACLSSVVGHDDPCGVVQKLIEVWDGLV